MQQAGPAARVDDGIRRHLDAAAVDGVVGREGVQGGVGWAGGGEGEG